jgi:hypothetical protein
MVDDNYNPGKTGRNWLAAVAADIRAARMPGSAAMRISRPGLRVLSRLGQGLLACDKSRARSITVAQSLSSIGTASAVVAWQYLLEP